MVCFRRNEGVAWKNLISGAADGDAIDFMGYAGCAVLEIDGFCSIIE